MLAVQLGIQQQPDLIIINVSKQKTALGLHRRIRSTQDLTNTPILVISTEATQIDFIDSTKDDILESPYQPITLAAKVARLVERKRTQDELDSSQQLYFDLFQNANDVVYTHDLTGRYTSLNAIGQQITGYSPEEIGNVDFRSLASPEDVELAHSMLRKKLEGEATNTIYELSIKAKDGTMIPFEVNSQLIIKNGKPVGVQGIARDIRARKEAEEKLLQLERAQKMEAVGLLAGGVAHDINNILTAIYGGCDSLQRELGESSPLSKHVHRYPRSRQASREAYRTTPCLQSPTGPTAHQPQRQYRDNPYHGPIHCPYDRRGHFDRLQAGRGSTAYHRR